MRGSCSTRTLVRPPASKWTVEEAETASRKIVRRLVRSLGVRFCSASTPGTTSPAAWTHFNSALLTDREGNVLGRYDKCHLVPFGEYVWFADMFPWLYQAHAAAGRIEAGRRPSTSAASRDVRYAPNICYENTLPHLIRGQVAELRAAGEEPDVLVNLTNDGWFWGSTELDMHLACAVFRAIECRKPFLIAANTGFSASIDSDGRFLQQGPRRDTAVLVERVATRSPAQPLPGAGRSGRPAAACWRPCGWPWWAVAGDRPTRKRPRARPANRPEYPAGTGFCSAF